MPVDRVVVHESRARHQEVDIRGKSGDWWIAEEMSPSQDVLELLSSGGASCVTDSAEDRENSGKDEKRPHLRPRESSPFVEDRIAEEAIFEGEDERDDGIRLFVRGYIDTGEEDRGGQER